MDRDETKSSLSFFMSGRPRTYTAVFSSAFLYKWNQYNLQAAYIEHKMAEANWESSEVSKLLWGILKQLRVWGYPHISDMALLMIT